MSKNKKIIYEIEVKNDSDGLEVLDNQAKKANESLGKTEETLHKTGKAANEAGSKIGKSFKGIGTAIKGMGIGGILVIFTTLFNVFKDNQVVLDAINTVFGTLKIIGSEIVDVFTKMYNKVTASSENFDALGKVVSGIVTVALTPMKLTFYGITLAIQKAQLMWEKSMFGGNDTAKILALNKSIDETEQNILEVGEAAVDASKDIITNFGEAIDEVSTIAKDSYDELSKIDVKAAVQEAKKNTRLENSAKLAEARNKRLIEQYDRAAEQQRQIRDDESKTMKERIDANDKLGTILEEQQSKMLENANVTIAQAQAQVKLNNSTENQVALIDALGEKDAILAQIEGFRSEQMVNGIALIKEKGEKEKEATANALQLIEDEKQALQDITDFKLKVAIDAEKTLEDEKTNKGKILDEEYKKSLEVLSKMKLSTEERLSIEKQLLENHNQDKIELDEEYVEKNKLVQQEIVDNQVAVFQESTARMQDISNMAIEYNNTIRDEELSKITDRFQAVEDVANSAYAKEQELLKKKLENGLLTQKQYDARIITLKDKFDAEEKTRNDAKAADELSAKKDAFEKNKKFNIANVIMDSANAIIGTWTGYADLGIPGTILAGIQTAMITALGAQQISTISSQSFAAGGKISGDLHAQSSGGVQLSPSVMAEGGEYVVNRAATQQYEPVLDSINSAGNPNGDRSSVKELIDYERLASLLNDKKVYVVSSDITDQQEEDARIIEVSQY